MATTKLTLSVEQSFVDKAKRYASKHHTSVSKLFSELLDKAIDNDATEEVDPFWEKLNSIEISPEIKSLTGILKGKYPDNMDYKDMKYEYLKEKYGL